jgi:hypothetical protein
MSDGTPTPAPTGEDKQWADLEAEVGADISADDADGGGETGGDKAAPETETAEKPAPIPYEELERRHRQTAGALKETREREQAARDQLKAFSQMVEEMRSKRAAPAEEKPAPAVEIDPNEDPVAYFQAKTAALEAQLAELTKTSTETREEARSRQEYQQFMGVVSEHEAQFAAKTPDYHQAAEFLEKGRRAELAILFPDTPQMQGYARQQGFQSIEQLRNAVFINDAQTVARNALMAGMNPAEAYYGLAKGRGYKPGTGGGGSADKVERANATIEAMRKGVKASKSISGGGGGPDNPLNASDLADLYAEDPEEFDRQWDKMAKAGKLG